MEWKKCRAKIVPLVISELDAWNYGPWEIVESCGNVKWRSMEE